MLMFKKTTLAFAALALSLAAPSNHAPQAQSNTAPVQVAGGAGNCPVYYGCPAPIPAPGGGKGGGGKGGEPQAPAAV